MNKQKVAAVVVTFNRKELLVECLDALLRQTMPLEKIFVVDNASTDGTSEYLKDKGYLTNNKIDYLLLSENTGSSGGFYTGIKRAFGSGADWIWVMDDDAEPTLDALEILMKYEEDGVVALSNLKVNKNGKILFQHRGYFDFTNVFFRALVRPITKKQLQANTVSIDHTSFVGLCVSRKAIYRVGLPKKEFFYQFDDLEYCIRLRQIGEIYLVPKSIILHKEEEEINEQHENKNYKKIKFEKLWLTYFGRRNKTYIGYKSAKNKILFLASLIWILGMVSKNIIRFDDHKINRIRFTIHAHLDGILGRFDNKKPKKLIYNDTYL